MRGRINIQDLINRPLQELREMYRISFIREEARAAAEKAQQEEENKKNNKNTRISTQTNTPTETTNIPVTSPLLDEYELEEAIDEMTGGGIV